MQPTTKWFNGMSRYERRHAWLLYTNWWCRTLKYTKCIKKDVLSATMGIGGHHQQPCITSPTPLPPSTNLGFSCCAAGSWSSRAIPKSQTAKFGDEAVVDKASIFLKTVRYAARGHQTLARYRRSGSRSMYRGVPSRHQTFWEPGQYSLANMHDNRFGNKKDKDDYDSMMTFEAASTFHHGFNRRPTKFPLNNCRCWVRWSGLEQQKRFGLRCVWLWDVVIGTFEIVGGKPQSLWHSVMCHAWIQTFIHTVYIINKYKHICLYDLICIYMYIFIEIHSYVYIIYVFIDEIEMRVCLFPVTVLS